MRCAEPGIWHFAFTSNITLAIIEHKHSDNTWHYGVIVITGTNYPNSDRHKDMAQVCCKPSRLLACEIVEGIMEEARNTTQVD